MVPSDPAELLPDREKKPHYERDLHHIIEAPRMLLIGAAGRNCGKTLLATELIKSLAHHQPISGLKVTTVHEDRGPCPRGGEGCGICSSLSGPYRITKEQGEIEGKDTTRMFEAGASPVYWMIARASHLHEGALELSKRLTQPSICESNSYRNAVNPGLFVIVRRIDSTHVRKSCKKVWSLADAEILFDGLKLDPPPEAFNLTNGIWTLRRKASVVVLAGGRSSRMGRDKALLPVQGKTMIEHVIQQVKPHFDEIIISSNEAEKFEHLGYDIVPDERPGMGPMMAIASALERAKHDLVFFVPCDIPEIPQDLLARVLRAARLDADICVPVTADGKYEPLFATYRKSVRPLILDALQRGSRQVFSVYDTCATCRIELAQDEKLLNVNTLAEYEKLVEGLI